MSKFHTRLIHVTTNNPIHMYCSQCHQSKMAVQLNKMIKITDDIMSSIHSVCLRIFTVLGEIV